MKLNHEQLHKIEKYLDSKNLDYADVRFEVFDHVVSEIEVFIETNKSDFGEAFSKITNKWNDYLKDDSSWFFGLGFSAPKIIVKKAKKMYLKHLLFILAFCLVPHFMMTNLNITFNNHYLYQSLQFFAIACLVGFFIMLFTRKRKVKSTYSFILNSRSLDCLTGLVVVLILFNKKNEIDGLLLGMVFSFFYVTYSHFYFFRKHQKFVSQQKLMK